MSKGEAENVLPVENVEPIVGPVSEGSNPSQASVTDTSVSRESKLLMLKPYSRNKTYSLRHQKFLSVSLAALYL